MSARRTALVGGLMVAAGPLSILLYGPALPSIVADLGTTDALGKLSLSAYLGAFAVAQLLCGPLSDTLGRRRVTAMFFAIYVIGSLVAVLGPSIEWLLVGRVLQGIGVSVGVALSRAMVRDQFVGRESVRILTLINLILTVTPLVSPTLGSLLLLAGNWHLLFVVMALYGVAIIVLTGVVTRETHPPERRVPFRPAGVLRNYWLLLRSPSFMLPGLLLGLVFGGFNGFATLLPFALINEIGLTPFQFAMFMLVQTFSFISGNVLAGMLTRRLSGQSMIRAGVPFIVLAGIGFLIGPLVAPGHALSVMVPVAIWMLGLALIGPTATAAAMANFGSIAGAAGALTGVFQVAGGFLASLLASLAFERSSTALMVMMPVLAVLTVIVAMALRVRERSAEIVPPET